MKKIVALLLACLLLVTCFAGCTNQTETEGDTGSTTTAAPTDTEYVTANGKLIIGITDFAPMDYKENADDEDWVGFDADMAKKFAEYLGLEPEFVVLADWGKKALELEAKSIDVVWNGMTITDEVKGLMSVSVPYCKNAQVVVLNADIADQYTTTDSIKDLTFAVESGSAGAEALDALEIAYTEVDDQAKALMEVGSGSADACVIDLLMAGAMIGEGTSYPDLTTAVELTSEDYGVGFRKGSDLVDKFNTFWKAAYDDGTVTAVAEQYGIAKNVIAQ